MTGKPQSPEASRLAEILAGMVRSALAWHEIHDGDAAVEDFSLREKLTGIPHRLHCATDDGEPQTNPRRRRP